MSIREPSGFTMVELVLTIVLLTALSVAAIPAVMDMETGHVDAVVRKLASDVSYAQRLARYRNAIYGVHFDTVNETYNVYHWDPDTVTQTTIADPLTHGDLQVDFSDASYSLSGIDIAAASFGVTSDIRFQPNGVSLDGNDAPLVAAGTVSISRGGETRTISVQPNTGEVSFQ